LTRPTNFYSGLLRTFWTRPAAALEALYWNATGRKVRARNRLRLAREQSPSAYAIWINEIEQNSKILSQIPITISNWDRRPALSICLHQQPGWDQVDLEVLLADLREQPYPAWELILVPAPGATALHLELSPNTQLTDRSTSDPAEALRWAADLAQHDFLVPLRPGVRLPPAALYHYAHALRDHAGASLFFGDHDYLDDNGKRHTPWLKPEWNGELVLAQDYVSQAFAVSRSLTQEILRAPFPTNAAPLYALCLAAGDARAVPSPVHVPHILAHAEKRAALGNQDDFLATTQAHLANAGHTDAHASYGPYDTVRVQWPLPDPVPLVSILIPTRDKVNLLSACVSSLFSKTDYPNMEVIIIDNGSSQNETMAFLSAARDDLGVKIIRDDRPYNYSQLNNLAAEKAVGDYLCLLNNDTEIIQPSWLREMIRQAIRPNIGAVGAKLLYDDMSIQHAGVVIGLCGSAGHVHRYLPNDNPGYFARAHVAHYVSAVTAACLVVKKGKFHEVGGLDEENLAIAFNDVDFCLKLEKRGWRNLYEPNAVLFHHESKSRGRDTSRQNIERYLRELHVLRERWGAIDYQDPLHHPHLDRSSETYLLGL